ncbi:MAG: hypothetical protein M0042_10830 [Nitrospiraceae bacterium]|nr:hypothetical protein [Nitrospiraceae bacterium]
MERKSSFLGTVGALWGLAGVVLLLLSATLRLSPLAVDAFSYPFAWYHWLALIVIVLGMAYAEGYKGFQQAFSPRTAARARYLRENPNVLHAVLAPFFCMGYFHATKRRKITSISLTLGIIVLIILVRFLTQPWRGIIDAGVVVGLVWGIVSLLVFSVQALGREQYPFSPEVTE